MSTTDTMIEKLRHRLGRAEKDSAAARKALADFRALGWPPEVLTAEQVLKLRTLATDSELEAAGLRGKITELETRGGGDPAAELARRQQAADDAAAREREIRDRIEELEDQAERLARSHAAAARARAYLPCDQAGDDPAELFARAKAHGETHGGAHTSPRGEVYHEHSPHSFFRDLALTMGGAFDPEARDRLARYEAETRAMSRVDGSGGQFVIPRWLVPEYVGLPRPGRVTADLLGPIQLPAGTDQVKIPKLTTGTATGVQVNDGDAVASQDAADAVLTGDVRTIAGQVDVSLQAVEQSAYGLDRVLADDLLADLAQKVDLQSLNGTAANGQVQGLRTASGVQTVTLSTTTGTAFVSKVAGAVSQITGSVFRSPSVIVMHPRRWAWLVAQVDASGRPFVVPEGSAAVNAAGTATSVGGEGLAGRLVGLPVYLDPNIPTNLGAGTNQDQVLVFDPRVVGRLWESSPRVRVLPEVLSGTLQVRIQVYEYLASIVRLPAGLALVDGSGLVSPSF